MKTIKIKSLKLTNFKGIRKLELNELSKETYIYGDNGVGKTSIFDAFTWLLFGKDSTDRQQFEIKTLDTNNQVIPKIDHEVEAVIEVNGEPIELRRILREKWVTKRGSAESEFTGNDTTYEWNGVPMNAGEFSKKISGIVDEKVFKMITNPAAFNALKWQDQRDVLIDMTGTISDADIANGDADFEALLSKLTNKSFDEYKKQVKASISKSKAEIKMIPTRIDEVERGKPDALDFVGIKKELDEKEAALKYVNDQISDELKAQQALIDQKAKIKNEIQKLDFEISDIKHAYKIQARDEFRKQSSGGEDVKRQIVEKQSQLTSANTALVTLNAKLNCKKEELTKLSEDIVGLRTAWEEVNSRPMSFEIDTCCPTCKQELPAEGLSAKRGEMEKALAYKKQSELDAINAKGKSLKETLEATTKERDDLQVRVENGKTHIDAIEQDIKKLQAQTSTTDSVLQSEEDIFRNLLSTDTKMQPLYEKIGELNNQLETMPGVNVDGLKTTRDTISSEITTIKSKLQAEEQIKSANKRIEELSKEEVVLAQSIADQERELYTMEAFEKEKSTRIEKSVNNSFRFVNFKLFETQINGGEVPTCKALIDGVPFSDANTASKINAGLDIINTLCQHYKANAPIFIDNRESVVELIPTESQIINLIVSEDDKKLRVSDRPMSYSQFMFKEKLVTV